MRLIGLNGRARSGKDTAVEFITDAALEGVMEPDTFVVSRAGFADKMKVSAAMALGFTPQTVEEAVEICNHIKETGSIKTAYDLVGEDGNLDPRFIRITGREYLQFYGTEAHRDVFGFDFWVDALLPEAVGQFKRKFADVDVLVVTDVRFENEAQRILDLGGEVWHIDAEQRLGPLSEDAHPSERPLPDHLITRTVRNNGSLDDFQRAISFAYLA